MSADNARSTTAKNDVVHCKRCLELEAENERLRARVTTVCDRYDNEQALDTDWLIEEIRAALAGGK